MKHSTCPSGKKGGSLGEFTQGQMVPEFDKVSATAFVLAYGSTPTPRVVHRVKGGGPGKFYSSRAILVP